MLYPNVINVIISLLCICCQLLYQMVVTHVDKYNVEFRKHVPYDDLIMDDVIKNIEVTRQML